MRIDGITCCVGKLYADQLDRALPVWLDTLDSVTIVTKPNDPTLEFEGPSNLKIVTTEVFTEYGAFFNKGAALCYAFSASDPTDWCLNFDADVVPPKDWKPDSLQPEFMYGAQRTFDVNEPFNATRWPRGYFQLWHTSNPRSFRWPIFETHHGHCGRYDYAFAKHWNRRYWKILNLCVGHQGYPRKNWFGIGQEHLMQNYLRGGYYPHKRRGRRIIRLDIPSPKLRSGLVGSLQWIQDALRVYRTGGPFLVNAIAGEVKGWETLHETPISEIKKRIKKAKQDEYRNLKAMA